MSRFVYGFYIGTCSFHNILRDLPKLILETIAFHNNDCSFLCQSLKFAVKYVWLRKLGIQYKFHRDIDMGHFVIHNHGSPGASKSISTYLHVFIMALNFYLLELDVSVFRLPTTAQTAMRASKTEYTKCGVGIFVIFSSVLPIRLVVDFRFCIFHVIWGNSLKQLQYITYPNPFSSCDTCKYYTAIVFSCFFFNLITELGSQSE